MNVPLPAGNEDGPQAVRHRKEDGAESCTLKQDGGTSSSLKEDGGGKPPP